MGGKFCKGIAQVCKVLVNLCLVLPLKTIALPLISFLNHYDTTLGQTMLEFTKVVVI